DSKVLQSGNEDQLKEFIEDTITSYVSSCSYPIELWGASKYPIRNYLPDEFEDLRQMEFIMTMFSYVKTGGHLLPDEKREICVREAWDMISDRNNLMSIDIFDEELAYHELTVNELYPDLLDEVLLDIDFILEVDDTCSGEEHFSLVGVHGLTLDDIEVAK